MKKGNASALNLHKLSISKLYALSGRSGETTGCPSANDCSATTCRLGCEIPIFEISEKCN